MVIIRHVEQTETSGLARILDASNGAESCAVWDQTIPPDGYIRPHYHETEEVLVFLEGQVDITLNGKTTTIEADATVLVPAGVVHSIRSRSASLVRMLAFFPTGAPKVLYPESPAT
jgi:quercetin dioxygenase-like cupin family protein